MCTFFSCLTSGLDRLGADSELSLYTYDALGRQTTVAVAPKPSGTALTTTATLDSLGHQATISVSGTSTDTLAETYDEMGRLTSVSRGGTAITSYVYNPDGTASSRTDNNTTTSSFTYTSLGQLASATVPGDATGVAYTWGLDGNMASRTWGAYVSGAYAYDGAKRPVTLAIKFGTSSMGTIGRTYDVSGNVTSETQTLTRTGGGGTRPTLAYGHTESFTYDAANRVTGSSFDGTSPETRTYTYDADSNRTIVSEAGVSFYYFYDNTDELIKKGPYSDGTGASTLAYDGLGNITTNQPGGPDSNSMLATTYTYDPAGHLTCISTSGNCGTLDTAKTVFTIDAAGRHLTQTIGTGATTTYAYLGTSDQITTTSQSGTTTYSAIDAIGDRLDQGSTSSIAGWLVPDLHGNIAAAVSSGSGPVYLTAYRYDPYGETIAVWNAASGSISVPWRFQGRMLESSASATDLYDFGARSYDPSLGAFTAFDSVAGSAQNPLTLNRYLYANANPATLVDPDGHSTQNCVVYGICLEGDERRDATIVQGTGNSGSTSRSGRGNDGPGGEGTNTAPMACTVRNDCPADPERVAAAKLGYENCMASGSPEWYCRKILPPDPAVKKAMSDALTQVIGQVGCGDPSSGACKAAIHEELRNMCADKNDDPKDPACVAESQMYPSFADQLPGVAKMGLIVAAPVLIPLAIAAAPEVALDAAVSAGLYVSVTAALNVVTNRPIGTDLDLFDVLLAASSGGVAGPVKGLAVWAASKFLAGASIAGLSDSFSQRAKGTSDYGELFCNWVSGGVQALMPEAKGIAKQGIDVVSNAVGYACGHH